MEVKEQMANRDTTRRFSVEGVTDDDIQLVRSKNILTLADAIKGGDITFEKADSVIQYWFTFRERRDWFDASNRMTRRKDAQKNLRDNLSELVGH